MIMNRTYRADTTLESRAPVHDAGSERGSDIVERNNSIFSGFENPLHLP